MCDFFHYCTTYSLSGANIFSYMYIWSNCFSIEKLQKKNTLSLFVVALQIRNNGPFSNFGKRIFWEGDNSVVELSILELHCILMKKVKNGNVLVVFLQC